ncbi:hypothetical protein AOLI_G00142210 [Acnodon oligacanthus]
MWRRHSTEMAAKPTTLQRANNRAEPRCVDLPSPSPAPQLRHRPVRTHPRVIPPPKRVVNANNFSNGSSATCTCDCTCDPSPACSMCCVTCPKPYTATVETNAEMP